MEENNAVLNPEAQHHKRTLSRGLTIKRGAKGGDSMEDFLALRANFGALCPKR